MSVPKPFPYSSVTAPEIKADPSILESLKGRKAYIWSGEWNMYWRGNCAGYTPNMSEAGIYSIKNAFANARGCGPEKKLVIKIIPESRGLSPCPHCGSELECRPYKPGYLWSIKCPKCPYMFQGVFDSVEDMVAQCNRRAA